ncbi:MAG: hypothetical protein BWY89_01804 [Bacteroidetes bacterium ADurb.BinA012]|nr:MAG: hypothetical protein BWY89_01804 [Bacteroidetes bacterium ADurb.BinA012]
MVMILPSLRLAGMISDSSVFSPERVGSSQVSVESSSGVIFRNSSSVYPNSSDAALFALIKWFVALSTSIIAYPALSKTCL